MTIAEWIAGTCEWKITSSCHAALLQLREAKQILQ